MFRFTIAGGAEEKGKIHYFYGLHSGPIGNLTKQLRIYEGRIPIGMRPIACDSFGNVILLNLQRKRDAAVFFWNHERKSEDEPTMDNISRISDPLEGFIHSLSEK